jgi:hypothetical protein
MRFLIRHSKLDEAFADEICGIVLKHRDGVNGHSTRRVAFEGRQPAAVRKERRM